jgi:DNA-binding GntR family transcriptional regulator
MQASGNDSEFEPDAADWRPDRREKLSGFPPHHGIYVSKTDLVAAALRELMITGDLEPGTRLRQRELAARFRVSPTPVREALRRLESEGLVSYGTHRGSTVAQSDTGAQREKFLIRAELEGLASSLAAPKITDEEIADLYARNEQLLEPGLSQDEINELNRAFHFRIYETARSPLLLSLMRLLWRSFPGGPQILRAREESHEQHVALLEALEQRDGQAATRITRHHILGAMAHLPGAGPAEASGIDNARESLADEGAERGI